jgi:eukaryotic-like serine/threonine-protein kinase
MPTAPTAPSLHLVSAEPDTLLGRVINDRYRIVEAIGTGGMGRVYKALQSPLDRVVALKVLGPGHDRDPNFYKRFFLEASVTAKLTHPNTITLYDYGRSEDGIFFIAMEYLNGRTLGHAMHQDGALAQDRVVHISQQICRSLREAHALGIMHRDLKPANVMLLRQHDDHDFVKVLDFGLVKFYSGEQAEGEITNAGTFMGSPHYIAPEQARNQSPDHRCDIYSLGVVMYQMLTGTVPFTAANPVDIILKHLHEEPPHPSQVRPELNINPTLEGIVLRCLAKERERRFQSMDELLLQLKIVRHHIGAGGGPYAPAAADERVRMLSPGSPTPPSAREAQRTPSGPLVGPPPVAPPKGPPPPPPLPLGRMASWGRVALAGAVAVAALSATIWRAARTPAPPPPVPAPVAGAPVPVLAAAPQTTTVAITSNPAGAEVLDPEGHRLGNTPLEVPVAQGSAVRFFLRHDGYALFQLARKSVGGERVALFATLRKNAKPKAQQPPAKKSGGFRDDPY